ncbi:hypothetical protein [Rhodococcus sp. SJ-2]
MSDPSASMIIVTYRNRPVRLGALHPTAALPAQDRRIVASDHGETEDDPVRDLTEDPTSRSVRLYRHNRARTRAMRPVTATTQDVPEPQVA